MAKIFVTEVTTVKQQWFYGEVPVSREVLQDIGLATYASWICGSITDERLLSIPRVRVEETSSTELCSTNGRGHTGVNQEEFLKEEGGLMYFRKHYGDRPAGFELRFPVAKVVLGLIVLDHAKAERRDFWKLRGDKDWQYSDWSPSPREAGFKFLG